MGPIFHATHYVHADESNTTWHEYGGYIHQRNVFKLYDAQEPQKILRDGRHTYMVRVSYIGRMGVTKIQRVGILVQIHDGNSTFDLIFHTTETVGKVMDHGRQIKHPPHPSVGTR